MNNIQIKLLKLIQNTTDSKQNGQENSQKYINRSKIKQNSIINELPAY